MRLLVTGGAGFIGGNLISRALEEGHKCRVLDNETVGSFAGLKRVLAAEGHADIDGVECVNGDVTDADAVLRASEGCCAIVHLAAHTNVMESVANPAACFRTNAIGTLNVFEAARHNKVGRVVVASSSAAVGEAEPPMHERLLPHPISPYGASKLAGEALASGYAHAYGIRAVSLRFANVYGPYSGHKGSVVALFIKKILRSEPLALYDAGRPTRDYVHVSDIVRAILLSLESGAGGSVYQIATGVETSTRELVELLRKVTGEDFETEDLPARVGEIGRNFSDISLAREELGFAPSVELTDGISELWHWFGRSGLVERAPSAEGD